MTVIAPNDAADLAFLAAFVLACVGWFVLIRSCERPR